MSKMEYNVCKTCGAKDGRAGMLWGKIIDGVEVAECENCHMTRKSGNCHVNGDLQRTPAELKKTFNILNA